MEIIYPNIPFLPNINNCAGPECLAKFISYWFGFGIMLAGVVALISLVIASIQLIASAGNPSMQGDARDRIKGAVLGMVLMVSAFILIRTINPVLVQPSLTPLGEVAGIFYTNGEGGETKPAPISESDTANVPEGFQTIIYKCAEGGFSPNLYVWKFPQKNFIGNNGWYDGVGVTEISCGENTDIGGAGSFKMAFKTPGVYYFLGVDCSGLMSGPAISDEAQITDPFKGNIKSIRAINSENSRFGFVTHKEIDFRGECGNAYVETNVGNGNCINVYIPASSINIFNWNSDPTVRSSGNGVTFYSKPFGWAARNPGDQSGYFRLNYEAIKNCMRGGVCQDYPTNIIFSYEGVSVPEDYKLNCPSFYQCPGSIRVEGNYFILIFTAASANQNSPPYYCQVFRTDVPNLGAEWFMNEGKKTVWVNVVPTK